MADQQDEKKTINPYGLLLLAALSGGLGNVGTGLLAPDIHRHDPYTGKEGAQERSERIREDEKLWTAIYGLYDRCRNTENNVIRLQEKQHRDHAK